MFQPTKEWVNKVNFSSFELENFFKIRACVISARKAKQLDATTMFTYSQANTPLGQSERAYYLSYFISYYNSRQQYAYYKLRQRLLQFTIACLLQFSTTVITIYDFHYNLRHITNYDRTPFQLKFQTQVSVL